MTHQLHWYCQRCSNVTCLQISPLFSHFETARVRRKKIWLETWNWKLKKYTSTQEKKQKAIRMVDDEIFSCWIIFILVNGCKQIRRMLTAFSHSFHSFYFFLFCFGLKYAFVVAEKVKRFFFPIETEWVARYWTIQGKFPLMLW